MSKSDLVDVAVQLHHETAKAWLVSDDGVSEHAVWIAKSQAELEEQSHPGIYMLTLPEWLAIERKLI